ncbi:MAG TPA: outer membrane beta-barrel protein [Verrucomicrobiae bacterium]|nr:outer membrane beta-barrel protein [Verrucomicrobiae bacterium]
MRVQKWTWGLAAAGLVSLPALVIAEEQPSPILTALSSTTISGYVDVSAHWNPGSGNANNPPPYIYNQNKSDGFNLDKVKLRIERPLDEAQWAAGYRADLLFGPDANVFATQSTFNRADFAIQQAYVALRAPAGNGLDLKLGVFDSIIGYESHDTGNNPNYTRSYGTTIEPHTHTGLLATYQLLDSLGVAAGIANTLVPPINLRSPRAESHKTYMASAAFTIPESVGFLAGSSVYAGFVEGFGGSTDEDQANFYVGATLNTPVAGVKFGGAFDYVADFAGVNGADARTYAVYASFAATEKMSLHARAEYADVDDLVGGDIFALTGTLEYDLWRNVLSRLEVRWDHSASGDDMFGGSTTTPSRKNEFLVAANFIYKF